MMSECEEMVLAISRACTEWRLIFLAPLHDGLSSKGLWKSALRSCGCLQWIVSSTVLFLHIRRQ